MNNPKTQPNRKALTRAWKDEQENGVKLENHVGVLSVWVPPILQAATDMLRDASVADSKFPLIISEDQHIM